MTAPTESTASILPALRRAAAQVAPAWPLDRFVAVNPYFGVADRPFEEAAARLARAAGARVTMPRAFYAEAVRSGAIRAEDLAAALEQLGAPAGVDEVLALLERGEESKAPAPAPTVADVAAVESGRDWPTLVVERVAFWAGAYFDQGQAAWASPDRGAGLWEAWRREAEIDRAPEVSGVRGFRRVVRELPASPVAAAEVALRRLEVPDDGLDLYLHRLLMRVGGWAAFAARRPFESALEGQEDDTLVELLAVLLTWELALLEAFGAPVQAAWAEARKGLSAPDALPAGRRVDLALQVAFERGALRQLVGTLEGARADAELEERPRVQAVFCIDVRSEVFRRALESVDSRVETLGFAGFFAFPIEYVPLAHEEGGAHCPVLLTPGHRVHEALPEAGAHAAAVERRRQKRGAKDAWTAFKMGAISCFSFVGPVGLAYAAKLFTDAFGRSRPVPHPSTAGLGADASRAKGPRLAHSEADGAASGLDLDARVELAAGALGAMSLTEGFARIVLVTGHGSSTVNNPHATSLDCGACGGRTGEASARVAAAVLNDPAVRAALVERAIAIPEDTVFVPALHDTTTDEVTLYDRGAVPASHHGELAELEGWLAEAGRRARAERASRLGLEGAPDVDGAVRARSRDWAQTRPEWGLAGCSAFVVAPRHRTRGRDLGGRAFLHSYEWRQDEGFDVLELIMTAPMVVASWIGLQYYASSVEPKVFGAGNKTLHDVVGAVGVYEGAGGDLRVGLPWQSVHDGEALAHDPLRLQVVIEAPREAMNEVIAKHEHVRHLVDHGWLQLFAMDEEGRVSHRYVGGLRWEALEGYAEVEQREEQAA